MKLRDDQNQELQFFFVLRICEPLKAQPINICTEIADPSDGKTTVDIEMLIGADCYQDLTTGHTCRGYSGPVAIQTNYKLGWVLSGPAPTGVRDHCSASLMIVHNCEVTTQSWPFSNLDNILWQFWELESLRINDLDKNVFTEFEKKHTI